MMGRQSVDQRCFFYDFCLEDHVPPDHLLRRIDDLLDLGEVRENLKPHYSHMGRPSVDPELMIRMLIVGYCFGIRSERRLCEEVHFNLAYRWFCRLGLETPVPDHSTLSLNRHGRFRESDVFRLVFEAVLQRCMAAGLVGGEGFAIDASVMEADASRYHGVAPDEIDWTDPALNSRAMREYLAALDPDPDPARKTPKVISPSDPCSAWTAKANKRVQFGYGLNYLIDNEYAIIVDVEATPARGYDEVAATRTMIERTDELFGLRPRRIAADTAYGTGRMLDWLYLAIVLDLFSRRIVGWAVSDRLKRDLALAALRRAITLRKPPPGLVHHSDRGSQYCSHDYRRLLKAHGMIASMSGKGNCYDNAMVETVFKTIKSELVWRTSFQTRRQAEKAIGHYIDGFYNPRRRHSALGYQSPIAFEAMTAKNETMSLY